MLSNRSLKDAKLRLFGYYFSKYLVKEILIKKIEDKNSSIDIEGAVRAIASIIALSKRITQIINTYNVE